MTAEIQGSLQFGQMAPGLDFWVGKIERKSSWCAHTLTLASKSFTTHELRPFWIVFKKSWGFKNQASRDFDIQLALGSFLKMEFFRGQNANKPFYTCLKLSRVKILCYYPNSWGHQSRPTTSPIKWGLCNFYCDHSWLAKGKNIFDHKL